VKRAAGPAQSRQPVRSARRARARGAAAGVSGGVRQGRSDGAGTLSAGPAGVVGMVHFGRWNKPRWKGSVRPY